MRLRGNVERFTRQQMSPRGSPKTYRRGRICGDRRCEVQLSIYNPTDFCSVHSVTLATSGAGDAERPGADLAPAVHDTRQERTSTN